MMTWRLDEILLAVLEGLGPVWFLFTLGLLLFVCAAPLVRAMVAAVFVLVSTQMWYRPLHVVGRVTRWWVLGILCVRGILLLARAPRVAGETRAPLVVVGLLGALALASASWSINRRYSFEVAGSFVLGLVITFGLLWRLLDRRGVMAVFARGVTAFALLVFGAGFAVAAVAGAVGAWGFLDATGWTEFVGGGRYSGVFYNPNMAGLLAATVLPIVVATPRSYLGRLAAWRFVAIALTAATIYLSGSRSAVLGSAFAIAVIALYRYGAGAFMTLAVGGVGLAALFVYVPTEDLEAGPIAHITRGSKIPTLSGRTKMWEEAWDAAQRHLEFGQGWGTSRYLMGGDPDRALELGGMVHGTNLHNAHLQLLVDLGFAGVALFWIFCVQVLRAGWRLARAPPTPRTTLALVVFASTVVMLADSFAHGSVFSTGGPTTLVFWGFCAITLKEGDRLRRGEPERVETFAEWTPPAATAAA